MFELITRILEGVTYGKGAIQHIGEGVTAISFRAVITLDADIPTDELHQYLADIIMNGPPIWREVIGRIDIGKPYKKPMTHFVNSGEKISVTVNGKSGRTHNGKGKEGLNELRKTLQHIYLNFNRRMLLDAILRATKSKLVDAEIQESQANVCYLAAEIWTGDLSLNFLSLVQKKLHKATYESDSLSIRLCMTGDKKDYDELRIAPVEQGENAKSRLEAFQYELRTGNPSPMNINP